MKRNRRYTSFGSVMPLLKALLRTKCLIVLLSFLSVQSFAGINAQDNITLSLQNVGLPKVFRAIEKQAKYRFVYKNESIPGNTVSIDVKNASLEDVLRIVLEHTQLTYKKVNNNLVVILNVAS